MLSLCKFRASPDPDGMSVDIKFYTAVMVIEASCGPGSMDDETGDVGWSAGLFPLVVPLSAHGSLEEDVVEAMCCHCVTHGNSGLEVPLSPDGTCESSRDSYEVGRRSVTILLKNEWSACKISVEMGTDVSPDVAAVVYDFKYAGKEYSALLLSEVSGR